MDLYSFTHTHTHTHTHTNKNELAKNALSMNWETSVESSRGNSKRMLLWSSSHRVSHGGGRLGSSLEHWEIGCGRSFAGDMREQREFIGNSHK